MAAHGGLRSVDPCARGVRLLTKRLRRCKPRTSGSASLPGAEQLAGHEEEKQDLRHVKRVQVLVDQ